MLIIFSFIKGFALGSFITVLSFYMDLTYSFKSYKQMINDKKYDLLYLKAISTVRTNLMIISPFVYAIIDTTLLTHSYNIQYRKILGILAVHSIGYYTVHSAMHKIPFLYRFHKFHHKFDKMLLPSIGNAVSKTEFIVAYITPFIIGAYIFKPNEISFVIPISIIGLLNIAIHCKELENANWPKWLVSPKNHIEHHEIRTKHFAAPTLNIDYFVN